MKPLIAFLVSLAACVGAAKVYRAMREVTRQADLYFEMGVS